MDDASHSINGQPADRLAIDGKEAARVRGEWMERKQNRWREKEWLTGSALLLPSAIKEVRTEGRRRARTRPMLQAQLHVDPIGISHQYLS